MEKENIQKIRSLYQDVDISSLSSREKALLLLLNDEENEKLDFSSLSNGKYRILQFKTPNFDDLASTLKLLLPDIALVITDKKLVVEKFSADNLTKSELFDVLQTLSQDTGEQISAFIGLFTELSELNACFEEERLAFSQDKTFSEMIFSHLLKTEKSLALTRIREELLVSPDDQKLVRSLYQTAGNQAKAAKILFVHRNTLLNKIKKYEQKYGLQLVGSDLVLAYHLL
ncbi:helix-turn-helix domain-containing protein [Lactococcus sp.]|uniref:helix-turn-helix domain-containing protein n=1 Tax=Lactococcus sp. TaxID=44273 RepID=UPI0035AF839C